jgi:hypothetical protein
MPRLVVNIFTTIKPLDLSGQKLLQTALQYRKQQLSDTVPQTRVYSRLEIKYNTNFIISPILTTLKNKKIKKQSIKNKEDSFTVTLNIQIHSGGSEVEEKVISKMVKNLRFSQQWL